MNILYMDCFSGISGNMTIGAFLDLGIDEKMLLDELGKINVDGYRIEISKKVKNGIEGTYFDVVIEDEKEPCDLHVHEHNHEHKHFCEGMYEHSYDHDDHGHSHDDHLHSNDNSHDGDDYHHSHNHEDNHSHYHRNLFTVDKIIDDSKLSARVKALSKKIFRFVAEAEAKVHGKPIDEIHFHEVGAIDSIIDIIGTAICIDSLKIDRIVSSPLPLGEGFVRCQHGMIPVPAPATLEIVKNGKIPVYSNTIKGELVTPTGAAIVAALADEFGPQPEMEVDCIGYGAGSKDFEIPNVLRLILGNSDTDTYTDKIILAETNIDDSTAEVLGYVMEKLFDDGALDVFFTPIYMKKCRPGVKLSFLANEKNIEKLEYIVFAETNTIGIRKTEVKRTVMNRNIQPVSTKFGDISVKKTVYKDIVKYNGEYEDIKNAAVKNNVPIRAVYDEINKTIIE